MRDWLPLVLHYVQPWLSAADIDAGQRWATEVGQQLNDSMFGILCLTRDNLQSPWILFEAGALAKSVAAGAVVPFLLDLEFSDVTGPLAQFQAKKADEQSTLELVTAINNRSGQPVPPERLEELFELAWPRLARSLTNVPRVGPQAPPQRSQRDVLEELVQVVRTVERRTRSLEPTPTAVPDIATQPDWELEAKGFLRLQKKLNAIKVVRDATGISLKEAKDLVVSWDVADDQEWATEAKALLLKGRKLDAIKRVREDVMIGLKDAKDLVESWEG
jgi:ribosomal protein L7/L12